VKFFLVHLLLTLFFFARDYTDKAVGAFTYLFFDMRNILAFIGAVAGLVLLLKKGELKGRGIGGVMFVIFGAATFYFYKQAQVSNDIQPEVFQSFNPLIIVSLTFLVLGIFTWLSNRGKEPSTPKKNWNRDDNCSCRICNYAYQFIGYCFRF